MVRPAPSQGTLDTHAGALQLVISHGCNPVMADGGSAVLLSGFSYLLGTPSSEVDAVVAETLTPNVAH